MMVSVLQVGTSPAHPMGRPSGIRALAARTHCESTQHNIDHGSTRTSECCKRRAGVDLQLDRLTSTGRQPR